MPVTHMTIAGNYFTRTKNAPINIHNVDGLKIHGNSVDWISSDASASEGHADWLYVQDCDSVSTRENLTPRLPEKGGSER